MDFSSAHLHLLLNHTPTIGFGIGMALLVAGLLIKSDHLKVASLVTLVGIALLAIPTYATGSGAQEQICGPLAVPGPCSLDAGVSRTLIEMHESLAFVSYILMVFVGGFAWMGLWLFRRLKQIPNWNIAVVLVLGVVAFGTVARAAAIGGEIRHTEIQVTAEATEPVVGRQIANFVNNSPWTWAANEAIHMTGLAFLLGVVLLIDLKLLGFAPKLTYASLDRMLPWGILGFGINAITGMLFFLTTPSFYVGNMAFNWKLLFLMAATLNMLWFTLDQSWQEESQPPPAHSKVFAATGLALWVGVMFWGSMLPFLGQAF
jgi:hypothetical protein